MVCPIIKKRLRWHKDRGHCCVLISASPDIYINYWALSNGFSDVMSTRLEILEGKLSGKLAGKNCFGEEKLKLAQGYLKNRSPSIIFAYGDSSGDDPMLRWADFGYLIKRNNLIKSKNIKLKNI